jgi:hypothetical protein
VDIRYKLQLAGNLGSSRFFSLIWRRCGELEILNCNGVMELEACGVILGGGGGLINGFSYSRIRGALTLQETRSSGVAKSRPWFWHWISEPFRSIYYQNISYLERL